MIGVRLMGGLGNQMFQYAIALRLSKKRNTAFAMDTVFFDNLVGGDTPRHYELDCFNVNQLFISPTKRPIENPETFYVGRRGQLLQFSHRLSNKTWRIYREPHHNFDPEALKQPNRTYLIGYWQTEKYFTDIRPTVLEHFSFTIEAKGSNKQLLNKIKTSNSVSIHVRRGDYVSNQNASKFHGTKDLDYYSAALKKILANHNNVELFVFSDDPEWCRDNMKFKQPTTYVRGNDKGFEDMRLMMNCKHNIIANSSFSWWAAWLNQNPDKMVVAPVKWFNDPSIDTSDVIPESWIKV